jgi:hypothetical protein
MSSEVGPEVLKIANTYARSNSSGLAVLPLLLLVTWAGAGHWQWATGRYAAVAAFALILLLYPFWRMGVRFDDHGVRIRGFLRTDQFGWPEVSHFADGHATLSDGKGASEDVWALAIVLHDGRAITVKATAAWLKWPTSRGPKMRAAIAQVAARYQIPAKLTGAMPPPLPQLL